MPEDINHPEWCSQHEYGDLDGSSTHMSAPIAWGAEGSYVRVEEELSTAVDSFRRGPRIYVSARQDGRDYCQDFDISPDAARLLASALLDAANLAQPGVER
jgi:hypothetical protein